MNRGSRIVLVISLIPLCWLGMMLVHEVGHVIGAKITGGTVTQVIWHPLVISRTDVDPNPSPLVVVWAGPLLGSLIPILAWGILVRWRYAFLLRFFAGYCLIANGAYIGYGSFEKIGDCRKMLIHETPIWVLWVFGVTACSLGFYLWNGLGPKFGWGKDAAVVTWKLAGSVATVSVLFVLAGFAFGNRG
ncbi:MAG: hypothetical protein HUJ26_22460 [Planctomycetaceae bacterium]|nr:hypothetical protein [Planctomycetaceae bacterium]